MAASFSVVRGSSPGRGAEGLPLASMAPNISIRQVAMNRIVHISFQRKWGEAQLIELKEHSSGDQQNAPKAALARHYVRNPRTNQEQWPEAPQQVDGDVPK